MSPDWQLRKNNEIEAQFLDQEKQVKEERAKSLRTDFETLGERRVLYLNIKNRIKTLSEATEYNLECRRDRCGFFWLFFLGYY